MRMDGDARRPRPPAPVPDVRERRRPRSRDRHGSRAGPVPTGPSRRTTCPHGGVVVTVIDRVSTWTDVCAADDLEPDRGLCARVGDHHVAVFRTSPDDAVYAIANHDPFSGASVLSRGIVGSRGDTPKVVSPIYKQSFDLRTGQCLDDPAVAVPIFPVRVVDGRVQVRLP